MTPPTTTPAALVPPSPRAPSRRPAVDWIVLVAGSAACGLLFAWLHLSAALLFGPLVAAIALAYRGTALRVPSVAFSFAQAVVGCMIAHAMPRALLGEIGRAWPLFAASIASVIVIAALFGWALARWRVLPGTTAVWGVFPGAATAMVLMAESFGADERLVALMQYLRVLIVGIVATTVARVWLPAPLAAAPLFPPTPPIDAVALLETLALAGVGALVARRTRIPAGALLLPMFAGLALQDLAGLRIELPAWLLAGCYALVGWTIGLRFSGGIVRHAATLLPRVVASILALVAMCGLLAGALAHFAHVDALTAYLATSPGGADTVAIIASASPVDVPFVMAMQTARFLVIAFCGPALARSIAGKVGG